MSRRVTTVCRLGQCGECFGPDGCECACHSRRNAIYPAPTPPPVAPTPPQLGPPCTCNECGKDYYGAHVCSSAAYSKTLASYVAKIQAGHELALDSQAAIAKSRETLATCICRGIVESEGGLCLTCRRPIAVQRIDDPYATHALKDQLGQRDSRILELEAECGRLALELRRATRKGGGK